jgi:hypothetical protein
VASSDALETRAEGNAPKYGEPAVGFYFTTMLQHTSRKDFLAKNNVITLKHPQYSSELGPTDLYLFPRLKSALKWWRFCDATDIINNATE